MHAPTQTPILFLYARQSDVVVNAFRLHAGYGDANKHVNVCVCWQGKERGLGLRTHT